MSTAHVTPASRWRRLLAGAIDAGIGWLFMCAARSRQQELVALFGRTEVPSAGPMLAASVGAGLATTLLRRRIAPTVEVLAKRQSP
jgi:hypothetical protein